MEIEMHPHPTQRASFSLRLLRDDYYPQIAGWVDEAGSAIFLDVRQYGASLHVKLGAEKCRELAEFLNEAAEAMEAPHA